MKLYINDYYNFFYNNEIQTAKLIDIKDDVNVFDLNGETIEINKSIKLFPSEFKQHVYESINTYRDSKIEAILSRDELMDVYNKIDSNCVLIYINEPDDEIEPLNYFSDELYVSFYTITSSIHGYKTVSKEIIQQIKEFVSNNSHMNKKFVIACSTGKTKSASLAVFLFNIESKLKEFPRYFVNKELVNQFSLLFYGERIEKTKNENFEKIKTKYNNYINKFDDDDDNNDDDD